ncbi:hypothetical protein [Streptomyces ipomoeae]|uniref:hypothetical protein n=1 Tax=Streptomyces ipomoeae TaxID=103232 RepID=UPI001146A4C3|nr:hypothetical protein [Streptomyces ipomoeae]MDX2937442.1 hypothetical protein [Streptomyces ipomoeae]TQE26664.1 hypothetical protein SipoB123_13705 [Streptomyces ipomoeae]
MNRNKLASFAMTPLVLMGVAVAAPIAGATAASAAPSQCQVGKPDENTGIAICRAGTGQVRVKVTCEDGITGSRHFAYGPWVGVNKTSKVACGAAQRYFVYMVDYQTR